MRPFWHASDAGLPVVASSRYLAKENDPALRSNTLTTIKKALEYNLRITSEVSNPGMQSSVLFTRVKSKTAFLYHMKINPAGGGREKMRDWLLSQQQL